MTQLISAQAFTITYAATDSSGASSVSLPVIGAQTIVVTNESTNIAFFAVAAGSVTATLPTSTPAKTCMPVPAGASIVYRLPQVQDRMVFAAICRSGTTATLTVSCDYGV